MFKNGFFREAGHDKRKYKTIFILPLYVDIFNRERITRRDAISHAFLSMEQFK